MQLADVGRAELRPFGHQHQRIGLLHGFVLVLHEHQITVFLGLTRHHARRRVLRLRIVGAHLGAGLQQRLHQRDAGRLAHVVSAWLEGQPPQRNDAPLHVGTELLHQLLEEPPLLHLVAPLHGVQHHRLEVDLACHAGQRLHVLGQAGATVTGPRAQELVPNARIGADAQAHVLHVHAQTLAQAGDLVHERDAGGQHGIGCVLGHLGIAHTHVNETGALLHEGLIQVVQQLAGPLRIDAHDDAIGLHEVLDGHALLQELGVRGHVVLDLHAPGSQLGIHGGAHLLGRAHRHRRLVDDQRRTLHVLTDLAGHGQHVTQVGRAVLVRGGAHSDAEDVGLAHGLGQRGGETQGAGIGIAGDDGIEPRLVDGHLPALEPLDALLADVHTNDPVALVSQAGPRNQTHITRSNNHKIHDQSFQGNRLFQSNCRMKGDRNSPSPHTAIGPGPTKNRKSDARRQRGRRSVTCRPPNGLRPSSSRPS